MQIVKVLPEKVFFGLTDGRLKVTEFGDMRNWHKSSTFFSGIRHERSMEFTML